jgi:translation initiation factor IF-3
VDTTRINSEIRVPQVRVIDAEGKQLGIMRTGDALDLATERMLDLVEVAPNANPPVCRLMDYGKYQFEKQKRERENRRAQKQIEIKEVRIRPRTDDHDIQVVVNKIRKFIKEGAKVRVRIRFRGREIQHPEIASEQFDRVSKAVADLVVIEAYPQFDGRSMIMLLAPAVAVEKPADKPAHEKPAHEKPANAKTSAPKPAAENATAENPVTETAVADEPAVETPAAAEKPAS